MNEEKQVVELMQTVYNQLSPEKNNTSTNPKKILSGGYAWCLGYVLVFDYLLRKEKYKTKLISLVGYIDKMIEQPHEVIEVKINNRWFLYDPTTNKHFKYSLCELLKNEQLIDKELKSKYNLKKDNRWKNRKYNLFCSTKYYKSVFLVATRNSRYIPITLSLKKRGYYEKHICNC